MKHWSISELKQKIINEDLDGLEPYYKDLALFLDKQKTKEDFLDQYKFQEIGDDDLKMIFSLETQDLMVDIAITQNKVSFLTWVLKQKDLQNEIKDKVLHFILVDLVMEEDEYETLAVDLYIDGLLSKDLKKEVVKVLGQNSLYKLAIHYQDSPHCLSFLERLDSFYLSKYIQDSKVKEISQDERKYILGQLDIKGRLALSLLQKSPILSPAEKNELIKQATMVKDPEIAYIILTQETIADSELLKTIIIQSLYCQFFSWDAIPVRERQEVEEIIILNKFYHFNKNNKTLEFQGKILVQEDKGELFYNKYYSQKTQEKIAKIFDHNTSDLPPIIKGKYNIQKNIFLPYDNDLDISSVRIDEIVFSKKDFFNNSYKIWKPDIWVEGIMELKKNYNLLNVIIPSEDKNEFTADNIGELRNKLKERIAYLKQTLSLPPMNKKRAFGVELEIVMDSLSPEELSQTLGAENFYEGESQQNEKNNHSKWVVKDDESIKVLDQNNKEIPNADSIGFKTAEIVSPKLYGEEGLNELKEQLNKMLDKHNSSLGVNISCGLHVHHDMTDFFEYNPKTHLYGELSSSIEKALQEELAKIQNTLYLYCSPDRRENAYCPRFVVEDKVKEPVITYDENRPNAPRPGFNLATGFGTVEFRMHEASLDIEKIVAWVKITHHLFDEIVNKIVAQKEKAIDNLNEVLTLMEIQKIEKIQTEQDLETALKEINDFIKNSQWSQFLIKT